MPTAALARKPGLGMGLMVAAIPRATGHCLLLERCPAAFLGHASSTGQSGQRTNNGVVVLPRSFRRPGGEGGFVTPEIPKAAPAHNVLSNATFHPPRC
ncbi:hypothetical protein B0H67DRAFT_590309 [Lasiosphaeris hirsuta]|uniref:Uncharacterized protein n=1 Tax=Lasiosphaeris hirsuta TaxID=260670 RepID=A0AA40A386_9PEZI|nr:hypothetical protein B0H67DRAFT_590309 [Lasiosphaeris hirsuta]